MFSEKLKIIKNEHIVVKKPYYVLQRSKECLSHFLTISINIQFAIFTCPFRLVATKTAKACDKITFVSKSWRSHKIICFILSFLGHAFCIHFIQTRIPSGETRNPQMHLDMLNQISFLLLTALTTTTLWKAPERFVDIANFIASENFELGRYFGWSVFRSKPAVFLTCFIFGINTWLGIAYAMPRGPDNSLALGFWWRPLVKAGRNFFFVPENNSSVAQWDTLFGVLGIAGALHRL